MDDCSIARQIAKARFRTRSTGTTKVRNAKAFVIYLRLSWDDRFSADACAYDLDDTNANHVSFLNFK